MTSFHSALSLVVLALISSCLAIPVPPNPWVETSSPSDYSMNTHKGFGERTAFDDVVMSSTDGGIKRSADDLLRLETFSTERIMTEDITRDPRTLNEMATGESFTFTPTTEYSRHEAREMEDSLATTFEPTTERSEVSQRGLGMQSLNELGSSQTKREFSDSEFTTSASSSGVQASEQPRGATELIRAEMPVDFTTNVMPSFTSTSSAVAPELYSAHSSTAQKYTGLLGNRDDLEEGTGNGEKPKKPEREPEEEGSHGEKPKPVHGMDEQEEPHNQHGKEGSEDEEPKPKHGKNNDGEGEKPHDKEESDEDKPKPKPGKGKESEDDERHEQHGKEGSEDEEPKPKHEENKDDEGEKPHYKEGSDDDKPKPKPEKYIDDEDKTFRGSYRKEESKTKEAAQEGGQGTEEGQRPAKQSAKSFEDDDRKNVNDGRLIPSRRPNKAESDDDTQYPKAIFDQTAWKGIPRLTGDFAVLDNTSDVVTVADKAVERPRGESKLNQGNEPSRAD